MGIYRCCAHVCTLKFPRFRSDKNKAYDKRLFKYVKTSQNAHSMKKYLREDDAKVKVFD